MCKILMICLASFHNKLPKELQILHLGYSQREMIEFWLDRMYYIYADNLLTQKFNLAELICIVIF